MSKILGKRVKTLEAEYQQVSKLLKDSDRRNADLNDELIYWYRRWATETVASPTEEQKGCDEPPSLHGLHTMIHERDSEIKWLRTVMRLAYEKREWAYIADELELHEKKSRP